MFFSQIADIVSETFFCEIFRLTAAGCGFNQACTGVCNGIDDLFLTEVVNIVIALRSADIGIK